MGGYVKTTTSTAVHVKVTTSTVTHTKTITSTVTRTETTTALATPTLALPSEGKTMPTSIRHCSSVWTGTRVGRVTSVIDGDTLEIEGCGVRLALVDAPEIGEPGGEYAKKLLESLAPVGAVVEVDQDDGQPFDAYGRILAVVYRAGVNVDAELLRSSAAKLFKRYCTVSEFGDDKWAVMFGCTNLLRLGTAILLTRRSAYLLRLPI